MAVTAAAAALLLAGCVVGYPTNLQTIPEHKQVKLMGEDGVYDKTILTSAGIKCNPNDGYIVFGAKQVGTQKCNTNGGRCDSGRAEDLEWKVALKVTPELAGTSQPIALCAQRTSGKWRIAGITAAGDSFDPIPDTAAEYNAAATDVLVLGGGVGGWAAAVAIAANNTRGIKVALMAPAEASTTQMSTGVSWFPGADTKLDDLKTLAAGDGMNDTAIAAYIADAPKSFEFWKGKLELEQFLIAGNSPPDYYTPQGKTPTKYSYQPKSCKNLPATQQCGAELIKDLKKLAPKTTTIEASAVSVRLSGTKVVVTDDKKKTHIAETLVIATGGIGHHPDQTVVDKTIKPILAGTQNTGFVKTATAQLGLTAAKEDRAWNLEFSSADNKNWGARWFGVDCAPKGVNAYSICADYSTRALKYTDTVDKESVAIAEDQRKCMDATEQSPSSVYWATFMQMQGVAAGGCDKIKLIKGAIDVKAGFILNRNFQSIDNPRIFASGTSAAHITGDKYFAPGSTIGLALHSGYMAAQTTLALEYNVSAVKKIKLRKKTAIPALFWAGTWAAVVGVAAHYFGYKMVHYALMPLATIAITVAVVLAVSENFRAAKNSAHAIVGYTVVAFMWINVFLGSYIRYQRKVKNNNSDGIKRMGRRHRGLGVVLLAAFAGLALTSVHFIANYYAQYNADGVWVGTAVYSAIAVVLLTAVVMSTFVFQKVGAGFTSGMRTFLL